MNNKQERGNPRYIQKRNDAERKERERQQHEDNITFVRSLNAISDQLAADEKEEEGRDYKKAFRDFLTIILIFGTVVAAGIGDCVFYDTMQDARTAATNQNTAMIAQQHIMQRQLDQMALDERAWIAVDVGAVVSDFVYSAVDPNSGGATAEIEITLTNTGKTPASFAKVSSDFGNAMLYSDIFQAQTPFCGDQIPRFLPSRHWNIRPGEGETIFPGQTTHKDVIVGIKPGDVKFFEDRFQTLTWQSFVRENMAARGMLPIVYGCITYKLADEPLRTPQWHQTGFVFMLTLKNGGFINWHTGDIAKERLRVSRFVDSDQGFYAY